VSVNDLVLVQGMQDTRMALDRWSRDPWRVLAPWLGLSLAIAVGLLAVVYLVASVSSPDLTPLYLPGYSGPATGGDYAHVLYRNSLVLALHAFACVAGFIAGSSLPLSASKRHGLSRLVHEKAGPLAIVFVAGATLFSLSTQAYLLGSGAATLAPQLGLSPGLLVVGLLPHAVPELAALFLPLAAWLIASRNDDWQDLLAATFVTVAIAVPVLVASAAIELWVTPGILRSLAA
jgi:uncharacterized membrane protein